MQQNGDFVPRQPRLDLDEYFPYLINRVGVALAVGFGEHPLRRRKLSIAMWRVMVALSSNGDQRQVDLGKMTSIDASTLSRLVTRLIRIGYVARIRSQTSNREVAVKLTPAGRKVMAQLVPIARRLEAVAIAGLSRRDLGVVKRALRRMYRNLARFSGLR